MMNILASLSAHQREEKIVDDVSRVAGRIISVCESVCVCVCVDSLERIHSEGNVHARAI